MSLPPLGQRSAKERSAPLTALRASPTFPRGNPHSQALSYGCCSSSVRTITRGREVLSVTTRRDGSRAPRTLPKDCSLNARLLYRRHRGSLVMTNRKYLNVHA